MRDNLLKKDIIEFVFPINGDCLSGADGKVSQDCLCVPVKIATVSQRISVNGTELKKIGTNFEGEVEVREGNNKLTALDEFENKSEISCYYYPKMSKKYRISVDDNIIFLLDINNNKDIYKSLFDNPYLNVYKKIHDQFGAKVNLNLFYQTDESGFTPEPEYFDLSMMTDKFKAEWEQNSDWLKLSFHAKKENPCWPYKDTTYENIYNDCMAVHREIIRFAGEKTLSDETTLHFGSTNPVGVKALRDCGYKALGGYFEFDENNAPLVAYFYSPEMITHIGNRDFWIDESLDMLYARIDRVLNLDKTWEKSLEVLEAVKRIPTRSQFIECMIHEQFFYKNYFNYIPDFEKIVVNATKWLSENGYTSSFLNEIAD